jgi:trigger factor
LSSAENKNATTTALESTPEHNHEAHDHDHDHEGHNHEGHEHHHHGPVLNPELTRTVELSIPAATVSKRFNDQLERYQKLARIPGFRVGKVPLSVVRARFGKEIQSEILETLLPEAFRKVIEADNLKPISQPQVADLVLEEGKPLSCKASFEILPEFSIDGYKSVTVEKPQTDLTEEEFKAEFERIRESRAIMEPVEEARPLKDGDWAQIRYTGAPLAVEGEATPQPITGEDVTVEVGGKDTLDAFNQALRGAKVGSELDVEVDYPADYGEQKLAGKSVKYQLEVLSIKKRILPDLDDSFAKELGEFETLADLEAKVREHMAADKKRRLEGIAKEQLMEALVAKFEFPVPETLVQQQIDTRLERGLRALAAQGMTPDDMRKLDFERLRTAQRDSAANEVKGSLVLDKIAEAESVTIADEDVDRELQILSYQMREPLEALHERLTEDGGLARIREQLRREKTASLLYEGIA